MDQFSQKAKQQLKSGLDFLHKKARETMDLTKLQAQLRQTQEKKEQALITLGERVCVMFDMDSLNAEALKDGVEQVRELQAQIQELERQLQDVGKGENPHAEA